MEIEIATIGGYEEVGRQMTAVRAGDDIVVFDMGLNLSKVLIHDDVRTEQMHSLDLIDMGAIPDDRIMSDLDGEVKAIVPTHGHLDHIGAISKLAHRYDAPIVAAPFTLELVKDEIQDENIGCGTPRRRAVRPRGCAPRGGFRAPGSYRCTPRLPTARSTAPRCG